jgi:GNAT superfamily N-acetyltransferase
MNLVRWTRFSWNLAQLPKEEPALPPQYRIRPILKEEERLVRNMVISALALDQDWADTLKTVQEKFENQIEEIFTRKEGYGLAVMHGSRIIGASIIDVDSDAVNHLVSGPSVLGEYCNRGIGSALLYHSLQFLRDHALQTAHGVTKTIAPAAKFVYRKFGSTAEIHDGEKQLVES